MKYYFKPYFNRMSFLGSVISAVGGFLGQKSANKASAKQAEIGRNHSDYQLQNKHQWQVKDLKKAGLNPILSTHGSSAGSSPIATAQNPLSGLSDAMNVDSNAKKADASSKDSNTKKGKLDLETELAKSQIELLKSQSSSARATANNQNSQANLTSTQNTQQSRLSPIYQGVGEATSSAKKSYNQLQGKDAWFKNLPKFGRGIKNTAKKSYKKWKN